MQFLKQASWLLAFLVLGMLAGIGGQQVFRNWRTPAAVSFHDYRGFLAGFNTEVVLFSTTTCPYCREARAHLQAQGVPFRELAIDESELAERAFDGLGEPGVPVLITADRLIRGYQPDTYRNAFQTPRNFPTSG